MSMSSSFSNAITSSTVSRLSAPRSSMKLASDVSLSRSTPSSSTMMSLTFSSSCFISIAMGDLKGGVGNGSQYHPAVDDQELPRNVAGEVGGEKEHGGGHILALAQPPQRDCLDQCLPRLGADAARQLGVDEPRRHGVHQDLARGKLLGHRLREPDEARLRGGVVRLAFVAGDPHDARDVDDPTPAPLDHPAGGVLRHQEGALEVGVEHGVPVVFVDAEQQVIPRGARVVHEHVDLLEFLLDRRDRLLYLCRLGDVARVAARPVAERPRRLLGARPIAAQDRHLRPRPRQRLRDGVADAPTAPGHESDLPFQVYLHSRFAPRSLQAAPARATAFGSPEMTVWSGAFRLAATTTSPPVEAARHAASTSLVASPSTAAIVPGRSVPACCISSPRRRTSTAASVGVNAPAVTYAEYSPREWPAAATAPPFARGATTANTAALCARMAGWAL